MPHTATFVVCALCAFSCGPRVVAPAPKKPTPTLPSQRPSAEFPDAAGPAPTLNPPASPFVAQVALNGGISKLYAAGSVVLVIQDYPLRAIGEAPVVALWKGGELNVDAKFAKGLPEPAFLVGTIGSWPDVRALTWWPGASSVYGFSHRYAGRGWTQEKRLAEHTIFQLLVTRGTHSVTLTGPPAPLMPSSQPPKLLRMNSAGFVSGPRLTTAKAPCALSLIPHGLALDDAGRIFLFGRDCEPNPDQPSQHQAGPLTKVEWFAPGAQRGSVATLPDEGMTANAYSDPNVIAENADFVRFSFSGTTSRLRFDGNKFTLEAEQGPAFWSVQQTSAGTQWAVTSSNTLVRREVGGTWVEVPLPRTSAPCKQRDCAIPLAVLGTSVFVAQEDTLYQLNGAPRDPLPRRDPPTMPEL